MCFKILSGSGHGRSEGPAVEFRLARGELSVAQVEETNGIRAWILPSEHQEASETGSDLHLARSEWRGQGLKQGDQVRVCQGGHCQ